MNRIVFTELAEDDLLDVWVRIAVDNEAAADRLVDEIHDVTCKLVTFPTWAVLRMSCDLTSDSPRPALDTARRESCSRTASTQLARRVRLANQMKPAQGTLDAPTILAEGRWARMSPLRRPREDRRRPRATLRPSLRPRSGS